MNSCDGIIAIRRTMNRKPARVRELVKQIGKPVTELSALLGIHPRTFGRYMQELDVASMTLAPRTVVMLLEIMATDSNNAA